MTYWIYLPAVAGVYPITNDITYSGNTITDYTTSIVDVTSTMGEFDFSWADIEFPVNVFIGELYTLELVFSNLGKNHIMSGTVKLNVPEGWNIIAVDMGIWDPVARTVTWNLDELGNLRKFNYEATKVQLEVSPTKQGLFVFSVDGNGKDSSGALISHTEQLRYAVKGYAAGGGD